MMKIQDEVYNKKLMSVKGCVINETSKKINISEMELGRTKIRTTRKIVSCSKGKVEYPGSSAEIYTHADPNACFDFFIRKGSSSENISKG